MEEAKGRVYPLPKGFQKNRAITRGEKKKSASTTLLPA